MTPPASSKKRRKAGLSATDVKVGQNIRYRGQTWSVIGPSPSPSSFWLHRWVDGQYETAEAKVKDLSTIRMTNQQAPR